MIPQQRLTEMQTAAEAGYTHSKADVLELLDEIELLRKMAEAADYILPVLEDRLDSKFHARVESLNAALRGWRGDEEK